MFPFVRAGRAPVVVLGEHCLPRENVGVVRYSVEVGALRVPAPRGAQKRVAVFGRPATRAQRLSVPRRPVQLPYAPLRVLLPPVRHVRPAGELVRVPGFRRARLHLRDGAEPREEIAAGEEHLLAAVRGGQADDVREIPLDHARVVKVAPRRDDLGAGEVAPVLRTARGAGVSVAGRAPRFAPGRRLLRRGRLRRRRLVEADRALVVLRPTRGTPPLGVVFRRELHHAVPAPRAHLVAAPARAETEVRRIQGLAAQGAVDARVRARRHRERSVGGDARGCGRSLYQPEGRPLTPSRDAAAAARDSARRRRADDGVQIRREAAVRRRAAPRAPKKIFGRQFRENRGKLS